MQTPIQLGMTWALLKISSLVTYLVEKKVNPNQA